MGFAEYGRTLLKNNRSLRSENYSTLGKKTAPSPAFFKSFPENKKDKIRLEIAKKRRDKNALILSILILAISIILLSMLLYFFI